MYFHFMFFFRAVVFFPAELVGVRSPEGGWGGGATRSSRKKRRAHT